MSEYVESRGPSLSREKKGEDQDGPHHLGIYAHPDATPESPRWVVCSYKTETDQTPDETEFTDGHEMLAHIAEVAAVPNDSDEEGY